jgi:hypothetical protein
MADDALQFDLTQKNCEIVTDFLIDQHSKLSINLMVNGTATLMDEAILREHLVIYCRVHK